MTGSDRVSGGGHALEPRPQLLTYPDSLGGDLKALRQLLDGPLSGLFRGIHILPPFPSSGDRGFAPMTYHEIDPQFGTWDEIGAIAGSRQMLLDLMANHISRQSPEFKDFERRGRRSEFADLFITVDKVWPDSRPPRSDIEKIVLRKPNSPLTTIKITDTGEDETVWTSFGTETWSEQVDLDVTSNAARDFITDALQKFAAHGVRIVRLDAVGYVIKKPGTSCFMVEPEIYDFLDWTSGVAASLGMTVLPEIHAEYPVHRELARRGYWTYDFVLPGLVLNALESQDVARLASHLEHSPALQFTALDCHDGVPVRPDLDGILDESEMRALAARVESQGGNINRMLSATDGSAIDIHQLNTTFYSAVDADDDRYTAARAIQLFAKGIPQIYYVGLLARENDIAAVELTGEGRAINRHNYTSDEIATAMDRPVVKRLFDLVRLRNTHPAFDGTLEVDKTGPAALRLQWHHGTARCALHVDLGSGAIDIDEGPATTAPTSNGQS